MCKFCRQQKKIELMTKKIESLREKLDITAEKENFDLHKKNTYNISSKLDRLITAYTREVAKNT